MRQRNRARSSSLFLLELIIAILFFSACAAVCVQFFVKSHTMSQDSQELNFAVNECTTLAEIIQSSDTQTAAVSAIKDMYPNAHIDADAKATEMGIYFNENFKECKAKDAVYTVSADLETDNGLINGSILAQEKNQAESIYELEVKHNEKR